MAHALLGDALLGRRAFELRVDAGRTCARHALQVAFTHQPNLPLSAGSRLEVAQLTLFTQEQFRAIAPAIREKNLHVHGEAIALIPENSCLWPPP